MSAAGAATFNAGATFGGDITISEGTPAINFTDTDNNYDASIAGLSGSLVLTADANAEFGTETIQFHTGGSQRVTIDASGDTTFTGNITFGDGHTIGDDADDNLAIASSASENIIIDSADDIILDVAGSDVIYKRSGTSVGEIQIGDDNFNIRSLVSDKDIIFKGNDAGSTISALTLDMSAAGAATFNNNVTCNQLLTTDGVTDTGQAGSSTVFNESGSTADFRIESTGNANMFVIDGGLNTCTIGGDTSINRGNQTSGELLLGGTTDGGFVDFDGGTLQLNTQRDPNTGTFINTSKSNARIELVGNDADAHIIFRTTASNNTSASERMRIDSSGNLIVGGTSVFAVDAVSLTSGGQLYASRTSANAIEVNRSGTDGEIVRLQKAGSTVGSIGTAASSVYLGGSSNGGVYINGQTDIRPWNTSSLANLDDSMSLGTSSARFKDLHLSGSANIAGGILNAGAAGSASVFNEDGTTADFRVESDSNTHMLFVDGGLNRVGINTSSPDCILNIVDASSPVMRIKDTTNDCTLQAYAQNTNAHIGTSSNHDFALDTNNTERMRLNTDGDILFGVTSLSTTGAYFESSSNARMVLSLGSSTTSNSVVAAYKNPNGTVGTVSTNGSATAYNTSSDARLKDVTGFARGLDVINNLNPVAYNWKADGKADEGLIAQEVEELVPNAISQTEDGYYQMDYSKLVTHLVKGMQEQQEQIESLKSEIADLKGE